MVSTTQPELPVDMNGSEDSNARFYTITDAGYFPGTVALLNSLRLTGHEHELVVYDRGLTQLQRELIEPHARLFQFEKEISHPAWLKPFPYVTGDEGVAVVIDSDIIVTGSLADFLAAAGEGKVSVFEDTSPQRWFSEWQHLFALERLPRQQTYVNSGVVAWSTFHSPDLGRRWWESCQQHDRPYTRGRQEDPMQFCDQDALNAVLMAEMPQDALKIWPVQCAPFGSMLMSSVRVVDERKLACFCGGRPTLIVHNSGGSTPWEHGLAPVLRKWRPAYVRLLRRVLSGPDIAIRIPQNDLPLWLRGGRTGAVIERPLSAMVSATRGARRMRARRLRRSLATQGRIDEAAIIENPHAS
jgi:hypothetical protein